MRDFLHGTLAVGGLTLREGLRQRLWLAFVAVAAVYLFAVPRLQGVDASARMKLAVAMVTGGMGFVAVLLAVLVSASALRRDLDARTAFMLFSKPLPRGAYLLGRWGGAVAGIAVGLLLLCAAGTAAVAWHFRGLPAVRSLIEPTSWRQVTAAGELVAADERRGRVYLSGAPGNGLRWSFAGLPAGEADLMLRADVRSADPAEILDRAAVRVAALLPDGSALPLELRPDSPYGRGEDLQPGQLRLLGRAESRSDLAQDYLRVRLDPRAVVDGRVEVQLTRVDPGAVLVVAREGSAIVARPAGGFALNLVRAAAAMLASAALVGAAGLACATVGGIGTSLLGGLTVWLAGSAVPTVRSVLEWGEGPEAVRRILKLLAVALPDFDRFALGERLAAGSAIEWSVVAGAWAYYGAYAAGLLLIGWSVLARREL